MAAIRAFMQTAPEVELQILMDGPAGLEQRVLDGSLHLALGPFPERVLSLQHENLYREEQFLYCASPHPLHSSVPGPHQDRLIRDARLIVRSYMGAQELSLLRIAGPATTVDNVEGRAMLILSGNCIGFLPAHYARPWEESGLLKQINPKQIRTYLDFKIIWRKAPLPARAVQRFIEHLMSVRPKAA